ncbi:hypothetical protein CC1G_07692 [Coprinopsis cinerea okayama7|uniref:TPR-like protein n=1 Tax=Coprinopsis cinerea (strain Okayama-7 / 130 / ATCC MYA-4618 / FGSC 9003) TaxID=240176 RepID=A8NC05_COPC7|nr:hypothetical protein CC1G_07692 [Coprinopsis cinerea okayama7\|eukprot:XP_001832305.2 hypothetical protein CC1G_07692 [Coprinopsis cinerea okayama7\
MQTYDQRSPSITRQDSTAEMHPEEPRFSAAQKGKHREFSLATCHLNRAPTSSARSTLFLDDPPVDHTKEGRLERGGPGPEVRTMSPPARDAHHDIVHPMAYNRNEQPADRSVYGPPRRSLSHVSALEDEPMSKKLRLTTPAFGPIGRPTPPHWSVDIYERQLFPKALGYPLAIPAGLRVGDVCFISGSGKIQRCFNITAPTELPHYFSVLHPPLSALDTCKYQDFPPKSYVASHSLKQVRDDQALGGLAFQCDANSEAAVLVFPQGAVSTELMDLSRFQEYISQNAGNWGIYQRNLEREIGEKVEIRLVTSTLTAPFWANAVVVAEGAGSILKFAETKTIDGRSAYVWDTRGFAKAAVSASDAWNPASRNDCTIVKMFTISPRKETISTAAPADGAGPMESGFRRGHPSDMINRRLLTMDGNARVVVSHDRDWCAIMKQSDKVSLEEPELLERVFKHHELHTEGDTVFLRYKHVREKRRTPEDLKKQIDELRESLDKISKEDGAQRAEVLHAITTNILSYLRLGGSKNPQHAEILLSVALVNAKEEVSILEARNEVTVEALHQLGSTVWTAFEMTGELKYLDQAIQSYRKSLNLDPVHRDSMSDLAISLWARFNRYKQQKDLDELIELYKALVFSRTVNDPSEVKWLNSLGMGLWERFRRLKDPQDMDQAVAHLQRASRSYPIPCDPFTLSNLGNALLARSRHRRDLNDLNEALIHYRKVLQSASPLHPGRSAFLSNLADALLERYERTSSITDLNEAVRAYEQTLELPPPHHRDKVTCILMYANALQDRFRKTYDADDLNLAIKKYREAKLRSSPAHPSYARLMENLLLAEQELRRMNAITGSTSPPPRSSHSSPTSPRSQRATVPPNREWIVHHHPAPAPPQAPPTPNGSSQKFRIVRPPMKKPYSKKTSSTSESEEDNAPEERPPSPPLSPRHGLPPRARRHHTLAHIP